MPALPARCRDASWNSRFVQVSGCTAGSAGPHRSLGGEPPVAGSQAQLAQAQAQVTVARNELQRTRQLVAKSYVSQAALEQAEAQARAAEAQVQALQAQVAAVSAQAGLHVLRAPFAGWVAQVPVSLGDALRRFTVPDLTSPTAH